MRGDQRVDVVTATSRARPSAHARSPARCAAVRQKPAPATRRSDAAADGEALPGLRGARGDRQQRSRAARCGRKRWNRPCGSRPPAPGAQRKRPVAGMAPISKARSPGRRSQHRSRRARRSATGGRDRSPDRIQAEIAPARRRASQVDRERDRESAAEMKAASAAEWRRLAPAAAPAPRVAAQTVFRRMRGRGRARMGRSPPASTKA